MSSDNIVRNINKQCPLVFKVSWIKLICSGYYKSVPKNNTIVDFDGQRSAFTLLFFLFFKNDLKVT